MSKKERDQKGKTVGTRHSSNNVLNALPKGS